MSTPAETIEIQLPCAFGLEAVAVREVKALGYEDARSVNGRVIVTADEAAVARLNVFVRTADRVQIVVGRFPAADFDQLFDGVRELEWGRWIGRGCSFPVSGRSVRSQLSSVPAIQRATKKAIAMKLGGDKAVPEGGADVPVMVSLLNDEATLVVDTTGPGLHKRGYRTRSGKAALRETLASAIVQLSYWNAERPLLDPFCGTGTILIEACWLAMNRPPGLTRDFIGEPWPTLRSKLWSDAREEGHDLQRREVQGPVIGCDVDGRQIAAAQKAVEAAGLSDIVSLQRRPVAEPPALPEYGCLITNPPYGERLLGEDAEGLDRLYSELSALRQSLPTWSTYVLSGYRDVEAHLTKADRRRKLYNATIEATLYSYFGPRPPR